MPTPVYMGIPDIKGSVVIAGREGTIEILSISHDLHLPTDIHTGRSTGVRQHGPMNVRAAFDSAMPLMYKAVTEGQEFPEVKLSFFQIDDSGAEIEYFIILLEKARVSSIVVDVPQVKDKHNEHLPHMVTYSFVYQRITWTFTDGSIEHTDDWVAAR